MPAYVYAHMYTEDERVEHRKTEGMPKSSKQPLL